MEEISVWRTILFLLSPAFLLLIWLSIRFLISSAKEKAKYVGIKKDEAKIISHTTQTCAEGWGAYPGQCLKNTTCIVVLNGVKAQVAVHFFGSVAHLYDFQSWASGYSVDLLTEGHPPIVCDVATLGSPSIQKCLQAAKDLVMQQHHQWQNEQQEQMRIAREKTMATKQKEENLLKTLLGQMGGVSPAALSLTPKPEESPEKGLSRMTASSPELPVQVLNTE